MLQKDAVLLDIPLNRQRKLERLQRGDAANFTGVRIEVVSPSLKWSLTRASQQLDTSFSNLTSLVLMIKSGEKRILLTGDARSDHILDDLDELDYLGANGKLHVDILKLPHQGSD